MRRSHVSAATLICLAVVGCGGDGLRRVAVQGKVTAKGVPLDQAVLQFLPTGATQGEGGIGRSDHDGNFSLTGTRAGDRDDSGGAVPSMRGPAKPQRNVTQPTRADAAEGDRGVGLRLLLRLLHTMIDPPVK